MNNFLSRMNKHKWPALFGTLIATFAVGGNAFTFLISLPLVLIFTTIIWDAFGVK